MAPAQRAQEGVSLSTQVVCGIPLIAHADNIDSDWRSASHASVESTNGTSLSDSRLVSRLAVGEEEEQQRGCHRTAVRLGRDAVSFFGSKTEKG